MPRKFWKHNCKGTEVGRGVEICPDCGKRGTYDGWHYTVIEFMGAYTRRTGLAPYGVHRALADELIESRMKKCPQCNGRGVIDINNGESWKSCSMCKGNLCIFDGSQEELEALRQEVLHAYPYALPGTHNPDGEETSGFTGGIFIRPKDKSLEARNDMVNAITEALGIKDEKKKPAKKKKSPSTSKSLATGKKAKPKSKSKPAKKS
jgi:hypothetical protein